MSRPFLALRSRSASICKISGGILYATLCIFAIVNGYANILGKIIGASLFMLLYVAIICMLTTALSIQLPVAVTGVIMILLFAGGAFRSILTLVAAALTGVGGKVIKRILQILPNLAGLSKQAGNLVQGNPINVNVIITSLIFIWIAGLGILFFRKKEA